MVKSLVDELSDILDWVENPGLGERAHEDAKMSLIVFCRGLVCGLRSGEQAKGDTAFIAKDSPFDAFEPDWDKAEAKLRENLRRKRQENAQSRTGSEANKDPRYEKPFPSDDCLASEPMIGHP